MYLKIPIINKKYTPLAKNKKVSKQVQAEFALYMADVMKDYLKQVIKNQQYKKTWAPLNVDYRFYKIKHNLSGNIWEATGLLVDSITVRKYGDHYLIGLSNTKRYPGSGVKLVQVAKWMEYGNEKMPARPLFRPVLLYLSKNVDRYWRKFRKERGY